MTNFTSPSTDRPIVLHFVAGAFTGATKVAIQLAEATPPEAVGMLVLCEKPGGRHAARVQALRTRGVPVETVRARPRWATVLELWRICRRVRPAVLVVHGFPEHLYGRCAGLLARVPCLMHVEHNTRERYTRLRRFMARWLARRTEATIAVSEGVRKSLLDLGLSASRIVVIPNGVNLSLFEEHAGQPYERRQSGIVMAARVVAQKDHAVVVEALGILAQEGIRPTLYFAGDGDPQTIQRLQLRAQHLGVAAQIQWLGHVDGLPLLLMRNAIGVLASHYEGLPLALLEAMAAGMAVVGSDVPGIRELIRDGVDGRLVPESDPRALAAALRELLSQQAVAARLAAAGRARIEAEFSDTLCLARYWHLLATKLAGR